MRVIVGVRLAVRVSDGLSVSVCLRCSHRSVGVLVRVGPVPVISVNVAVGKGVEV